MSGAGELEAERLLVEASQREPRHFARLYERYFDRVYAFALTRTRDRAEAEDVTAATFERAFQNLSRFRWVSVPFSAWLFRIAANAATDLRRQHSHEAALDREPVDEGSECWEHRFIEVEERAQLFGLVHRLPRDQQRVLFRRFGRDQSLREVARAMKKSEGAIKQLQVRAIRRLREWMGGCDE